MKSCGGVSFPSPGSTEHMRRRRADLSPSKRGRAEVHVEEARPPLLRMTYYVLPAGAPDFATMYFNASSHRKMPSMNTDRIRLLVISFAVGASLGIISVFGEGVGVPRAVGILVNLAFPWGLTALLVGRLSPSPRFGALAGGATLIAGMLTFYLVVPAIYLQSARNLVWTAVALVIGPVMGWCGAMLRSDRANVQTLAVATASGVFLAESAWVAIERRAWLWKFRAETYRLQDASVLVAITLLAVTLPLVFVTERRRLPAIYFGTLIVASVGLAGFSFLYRALLRF